jgi:CCR4-NOT transcriptional regulation complex NOT5 subunit
VAPSTFRIPISFVFCSAVNEAKPKIPRHAIKIAKLEKIMKRIKNRF